LTFNIDYFASGGNDGTVNLWQVKVDNLSGLCSIEIFQSYSLNKIELDIGLVNNQLPIQSLKFRLSSLLVGTKSGNVYSIPIRSQEQPKIRPISAESKLINPLALLPEEDTQAAFDFSLLYHCVDSEHLLDVDITAGNEFIVALTETGSLIVWDFTTLRKRASYQFKGTVSGLAVSKLGTFCLVSTSNAVYFISLYLQNPTFHLKIKPQVMISETTLPARVITKIVLSYHCDRLILLTDPLASRQEHAQKEQPSSPVLNKSLSNSTNKESPRMSPTKDPAATAQPSTSKGESLIFIFTLKYSDGLPSVPSIPYLQPLPPTYYQQYYPTEDIDRGEGGNAHRPYSPISDPTAQASAATGQSANLNPFPREISMLTSTLTSQPVASQTPIVTLDVSFDSGFMVYSGGDRDSRVMYNLDSMKMEENSDIELLWPGDGIVSSSQVLPLMEYFSVSEPGNTITALARIGHNKLLVGDSRGGLRIFPFPPTNISRSGHIWSTHLPEVAFVRASRDGQWALTYGNNDRTILVWRVGTKAEMDDELFTGNNDGEGVEQAGSEMS
jgi:WD40 repeat protein